MKGLQKIRPNQFLWHLIFVTIFILLEMSLIILFGTKAYWYEFVVFYSIDILFFYLSTYFLIPYLRKYRHYIQQILMVIAWNVLFTLFTVAVYVALYNLRENYLDLYTNSIRLFARSTYLFGLALGFWYARFSIYKERRSNEQEIELMAQKEREARLENALLRSQVSPHLLFNSLSVLHAKVTEKSPESAELLLSLAELMDYTVRMGRSDELTTLFKEIIHIGLLIKIHRDMHSDGFYLDFHCDVHDDVADRQVPPLIFTNFVENVFKHGVIDDPGRPATITLVHADGILIFTTENAVRKKSFGRSGGLGLKNSRQRLQRYYDSRHDIKIVHREDYFKLILKIEL